MAAINQEYLIGVKRELRDALRDVFTQVPDARLQATNISLEWPLTPEKYPAIFITFSEGPIENVGVAHYDIDDTNAVAKQWKFRGTVNFNIVATSPFERDVIANTLVQIIAFGDTVPEFQQFHEDIHDYDFAAIKLMTDRIMPGGEATAPVPWGDENAQLYTRSYSVELFGEFFTDPQTADLISISKISLYPYTPGSMIPTGSSHPDDADVPWSM